MAAPKFKKNVNLSADSEQKKLFLVDDHFLKLEHQRKIDKYKKNLIIELMAEVISFIIVFFLCLIVGAVLLKPESKKND